MFVIELIYKAGLEAIDAHMAEHVRKIPREGGIILSVGRSREEIEAIVREDPFCRHGLADFRIIEFRASQKATDIQQRIESS
jgi:hypothetical protein